MRRFAPVIRHVDVPHDGPQVLAFRVPAEPLAELRLALRTAYVDGDGEALARVWRQLVPSHRDELRRVRWRVPGETVRGLLQAMKDRCHEALEVTAIRSRHGPAPEDDCLWVAEACEAQLAALSSRSVDFAPSRWLFEALRIRFQLRAGWNPAEGHYPLNFQWAFWARWVEAFDQRSTAEDWGEELEEPVDEGLLSRVGKVEFLQTMVNPRTFAVSVGEPITLEEAAEEHVDFLGNCNHLRFGDGETSSSMGTWEAACRAMRVPAMLESLVGPWVPSAGPGPFVPIPDAAEPLVSQSPQVLPLFRYGWARGEREAASWWWCLSGDGLGGALQAIPEQPVRVEHDHSPSDVDGEGFRWVSWEAAADSHWTLCRERWADLLADAQRSSDAILLTHWLPDDQGTRISPLEEDMGTRHLRPALRAVD